MTDDQSPLKSYRIDNRISLQKMADMFPVHKTTVLRWEAGDIPVKRVLQLEKITGISRKRLRPDLFNAA
jgi:DNA-binding transcriptional regulator YdaS (Cro superfamily)